MARSSIIWIGCLTVLLACMGCNRKTVYYHYEHTPVSGWDRRDTLHFNIGPVEEGGEYRQEVGLRISSDYPYMGLNLIIEQTTAPNFSMRTDTLNCQLMDDDGTIKGHGLSYYQYDFQLPPLSLNKGDSLTVRIHHSMRRETLPGIADIGIKLSKN